MELANCGHMSPKTIDPVYVPPPQQAEMCTNADSELHTFLPQPESCPQYYYSGEMSGSGDSTEPAFDF